MLALTTYPEPRNLWIDFAFLGLSTITSERPLPASGAARRLSAFSFVGLAAEDFAGFDRFAVLVSAEAARSPDGLADLRATVFSYPFPRKRFPTSSRACRRRPARPRGGS